MRFLAILRVLIIYRLDKLLPSIWWLYPIKFILIFLPWSYNAKGKLPRAKKIVGILEDLGVIFIKFGQVLSTRRDLLPKDIGDELAKLQDNCKPFADKLAIQTIEKSLAKKIPEVFDDFSKKPLASASIAQVYTAKLKNGDEIVIKVVRPNIDKEIARDLKLIYKFAKIANFHPILKRLRPVQVVKEFEFIITAEPNMNAEAANAALLRDNFKDSDLLYVPKIYFDLSSRDILVMERIYGTPIGDIDTLKAKNIDFKKLAEDGVKIFFTQVFKHNFFHADMHPGNIFVTDNSTYNGVDFGIMGSLTDEDRLITANLFRCFFNKDYKGIANIFITSGWIDKKTNSIAFETAVRTICSPMFAKSLGDISFGEVLLNLFNEARKFDAYIQPQLLLLDKTLLSVEGLGRQLYPQLDLWATAKPLLEEIIKEELSFKNKIKSFKNNFPQILQNLEKIPKLLNENIESKNKNQQIIDKLYKNQNIQGLLIISLIIALWLS